MSCKVIKCRVADEYVLDAGQVIGAEGSHNDVYLELDFSPMWDGLSKRITWVNALGENPVVTILGVDLLASEDGRVYRAPVPHECKAIAGNMTMTVRGAAVEDGTETRATVTATARFRVLPAAWDDSKSAPITASQADQLQAQIEKIKADLIKAALTADALEEAKEAAEGAKQERIEAEKCAERACRCARNAADSAQGAEQSAGLAVESAQSASASSISARAAAAEAFEARDEARDAADRARADCLDAAKHARAAERAAASAEQDADIAGRNAKSSDDSARESAYYAAEAKLHAVNSDKSAKKASEKAVESERSAETALGNQKQAERAAESSIYNAAIAERHAEEAKKFALFAEGQAQIVANAGSVLGPALAAAALLGVVVTIPNEGWQSGGVGRYPYHLDFPMILAAEKHVPNLSVFGEGERAALMCGFAPFVQSMNGAVRFYAASIPAASFQASLSLLSVSESAEETGRSQSIRVDVLLPVIGWTQSDTGTYRYSVDIPVSVSEAESVPILTILPAGHELAIACKLAPFAQALEGAIRVYAGEVPVEEIPASLLLQGKSTESGTGPMVPATAETIGGVKPGDGLKVSDDGTIAVDTLTDEEFAQAMAEVYDS